MFKLKVILQIGIFFGTLQLGNFKTTKVSKQTIVSKDPTENLTALCKKNKIEKSIN